MCSPKPQGTDSLSCRTDRRLRSVFVAAIHFTSAGPPLSWPAGRDPNRPFGSLIAGAKWARPRPPFGQARSLGPELIDGKVSAPKRPPALILGHSGHLASLSSGRAPGGEAEARLGWPGGKQVTRRSSLSAGGSLSLSLSLSFSGSGSETFEQEDVTSCKFGRSDSVNKPPVSVAPVGRPAGRPASKLQSTHLEATQATAWPEPEAGAKLAQRIDGPPLLIIIT